MELSKEQCHGLGIALNEAVVLGVAIDPLRRVVAVTLRVLSLPADGPSPEDARVSLRLSPVGRVAACLHEEPWDYPSTPAVPFDISNLPSVVQSFGGLPIDGWEFFDIHDRTLATWGHTLSLDWNSGDDGRSHSITLSQQTGDRDVDLIVWFDELEIRDVSEAVVLLEQFIADGKRWWDALWAGDPRTSGRGIVPQKPIDVLEATTERAFSWEFSVTNKSGWVTRLKCSSSFLGAKANFKIDEKEYEVRGERGGRFGYAYSLKFGDELIANAEVNASYFRGFSIFYSGRSLELKATDELSSLSRLLIGGPFDVNFLLLENTWQAGRIHMGWTGWFFKRRKASIYLLEELPMPVKVFIFSLVVFAYMRTVDESPGI
jgi:hypothetical protein